MYPLNHRKPSLDNACARVRRARQHLTRLKREVTTFWKSKNISPLSPPPEGINGFAFIHYPETKIPPIWGIIVGEFVYNLRAALDYLIAELAFLDSGKIQKGTQFPIEHTTEGWHGKLKAGFLKGLSDKHKAVIERLQPYNGCVWTGRLQALSNPDKHIRLTVTTATKMAINPIFSDKGETPKLLAPMLFEAHSEPMKVYGYIALEPAFSDGRPVIITLDALLNDITEILDSFNPEFK